MAWKQSWQVGTVVTGQKQNKTKPKNWEWISIEALKFGCQFTISIGLPIINMSTGPPLMWTHCPPHQVISVWGTLVLRQTYFRLNRESTMERSVCIKGEIIFLCTSRLVTCYATRHMPHWHKDKIILRMLGLLSNSPLEDLSLLSSHPRARLCHSVIGIRCDFLNAWLKNKLQQITHSLAPPKLTAPNFLCAAYKTTASFSL